MSKSEKIIGRAVLNARRNPGEVIDPMPVEIPAGTRKLPSINQQIQEQIAIQIAKKQTGK